MSRNAGPDSAIYKTVDGGGTWTKLTNGLPTGRIGKIGLDIYAKNPEILYVGAHQRQPGCVAWHAWRMHRRTASRARGRRDVSHRQRRRELEEKSIRAEDDLTPKGSGYIGSGDEDCDGFTQVRIDPNNDTARVHGQQLAAAIRPTAGRRGAAAADHVRRASSRTSSAMCAPSGSIRKNSDRMIIGDDGGFALSHDGGKSSDHISHLPVGEPYAVGYDMEDPYNIYASLQDHEDWKGPSIGPMGFTSLLDWFAISSGDGMHTRVDPADGRWAYTTSEWGGVFRTDQKLGYRVNIRPTRPGGGPPYRFIWGTPLHVSPHNGSILYTGGEVLLKSVDRGDHWTEISPDLSTNDPAILAHSGEHGVQLPRYWMAISTDLGVTGHGGCDLGRHERREGAPDEERRRGLDGHDAAHCRRRRTEGHVRQHRRRLRRTRPPAPTSRKAATRRTTSVLTCYATDDFGATWRSIAGNLPNETIHIVWEDNRNPDLLFVGTGGGVFVTIDRGKAWVKMNNNMPNVPVLDLAVHPRERDLIVAGFGRNVFVTNVSALQELKRHRAGEGRASVRHQAGRPAGHLGVRRQRPAVLTAVPDHAERGHGHGDPVLREERPHRGRDRRGHGHSRQGGRTPEEVRAPPGSTRSTGTCWRRRRPARQDAAVDAVVVRATLRRSGRRSVTTWSPWRSEDRSSRRARGS